MQAILDGGFMEDDEESFVPSKNYDFRFSRESLCDIKRVFDIYDDDFDGIVGIKYLGTMLRAIGLIMTDADIVNIEKDADPEKRGEVELGYFFVIAARRFRDQDSIELAAKKAFSKMSKSTLISGEDDIQISAIKTMLMQRGGETLSESDLDAYMKIVEMLSYNTEKSKVSIKKLVRYMFDNKSIEEMILEQESPRSETQDRQLDTQFS
eukprot:CAMPEP_0119053504 /NCGR_PEP_ID=MMETSP1177-20130426/74468_1 /TAXON_ID=2985 /ORGANISM="Ochromonas sp, Strain CCMP1899" /LENGTH=208 /DNA_ID=CAMNT_0007033473 /DNA_START=128 /DNA_END=754 /DNA_ORIENTATION=+